MFHSSPTRYSSTEDHPLIMLITVVRRSVFSSIFFIFHLPEISTTPLEWWMKREKKKEEVGLERQKATGQIASKQQQILEVPIVMHRPLLIFKTCPQQWGHYDYRCWRRILRVLVLFFFFLHQPFYLVTRTTPSDPRHVIRRVSILRLRFCPWIRDEKSLSLARDDFADKIEPLGDATRIMLAFPSDAGRE